MNQMQAMKAFVEVVRRGSFARAAHALHLATATVSAHVANLERHVGVTLLNRTTRTVALTDEGADYYAVCERVLEQLGEAEAGLGRSRNSPAGLLRVDAGDGIVSRLLLPVLPEFQKKHPGISLHLLQNEHMFDLSQHGFDVTVRSLLAPPENTRLIARPLGPTRTVIAASPAYLAAHGTPRTPQDLLRHRCIGFIDPLSHRVWEWFFEREGKRFSLELSHPLAMARGELRVDAALRGLGIINDLQFNIAPLLRTGKLVPLLESWSYSTSLLHVLYPRTRQVSPKLKAFVNFLLAKYPADRELDPPE